MVVTNEPIEDLVREMYARFGLAYYHSEVLHRELCIILAMSDLPRKEMITELAGRIPVEYSTRLEEVREKRNFLAHHFWFDRVHLMFRAENIQQLIEELDGYTAIFSRLDGETTAWFHERQNELGITDNILQDSIVLILSGKGVEPLPGKDVVKELKRNVIPRPKDAKPWEYEFSLKGGAVL